MAAEKNNIAASSGEGNGYEMKLGLGTIAMLISATGMGLVPLFSRWATRVDMFDGTQGLAGSDSIGALMACGRMGMGVIFFILMFATHKVATFKKLKLTPAIALGGLMIGMSLACYVTSTLMTTVANAVLFIYIGPVVCVLLARIFRKEPISLLQGICLIAVFVGMLFGNNLLGFGVGGQAFGFDFNLATSTPEFPMKGVGDIFGFLSGLFYGASMFFNGYRKDADTTARGVWNFIFATIGAVVIVILMNVYGMAAGAENWILTFEFTPFNWVGAILLWIVCGPVALGFLLVAGRNLPAADYGTIAYWEVPVAIFIGLVVFGEALTANTIIGAILIVGGGAVPSIKGMIAGRKQKQEEGVRETLSANLEAEAEKEGLK